MDLPIEGGGCDGPDDEEGSLEYFDLRYAPEVLQVEEGDRHKLFQDAAVDLWGIGLMLWEMHFGSSHLGIFNELGNQLTNCNAMLVKKGSWVKDFIKHSHYVGSSGDHHYHSEWWQCRFIVLDSVPPPEGHLLEVMDMLLNGNPFLRLEHYESGRLLEEVNALWAQKSQEKGLSIKKSFPSVPKCLDKMEICDGYRSGKVNCGTAPPWPQPSEYPEVTCRERGLIDPPCYSEVQLISIGGNGKPQQAPKTGDEYIRLYILSDQGVIQAKWSPPGWTHGDSLIGNTLPWDPLKFFEVEYCKAQRSKGSGRCLSLGNSSFAWDVCVLEPDSAVDNSVICEMKDPLFPGHALRWRLTKSDASKFLMSTDKTGGAPIQPRQRHNMWIGVD